MIIDNIIDLARNVIIVELTFFKQIAINVIHLKNCKKSPNQGPKSNEGDTLGIYSSLNCTNQNCQNCEASYMEEIVCGHKSDVCYFLINKYFVRNSEKNLMACLEQPLSRTTTIIISRKQ